VWLVIKRCKPHPGVLNAAQSPDDVQLLVNRQVFQDVDFSVIELAMARGTKGHAVIGSHAALLASDFDPLVMRARCQVGPFDAIDATATAPALLAALLVGLGPVAVDHRLPSPKINSTVRITAQTNDAIASVKITAPAS